MNDSKYGRLYPERAVLRMRRLCEALLVTATAAGHEAKAIVDEAALRGVLEDLDHLGFPADEPLFLLRGQDKLAPCTVKHYAEDIRLSKIPEPTRSTMREHILAFADRMEAWEPRKLPD